MGVSASTLLGLLACTAQPGFLCGCWGSKLGSSCCLPILYVLLLYGHYLVCTRPPEFVAFSEENGTENSFYDVFLNFYYIFCVEGGEGTSLPITHVEVRGQLVRAGVLPPCGGEFCSNYSCLILSPWSPELHNFLCYTQLPNSILVLWCYALAIRL